MTAENQKLLERLVCFGENSISLCQKLAISPINKPLINQYIKSSSSIGANYSEACSAESARDFVHKIKILLKEARESKLFLRLILKANPQLAKHVDSLETELDEITRIFITIVSKFKS